VEHLWQQDVFATNCPNPIAVRRRNLIAKIDEQIQLVANKDYTPTQHKWVTDEHGNQRKVEFAKRAK